jgi:hypothetical protein
MRQSVPASIASRPLMSNSLTLLELGQVFMRSPRAFLFRQNQLAEPSGLQDIQAAVMQNLYGFVACEQAFAGQGWFVVWSAVLGGDRFVVRTFIDCIVMRRAMKRLGLQHGWFSLGLLMTINDNDSHLKSQEAPC